MKLRFHLGVVLGIGAAMVIACGSSGGGDNGFGSSGGTSGGASGASGSSSFGGTSGGEGGTSGSSGGDSGSCVAPVDMFVMFDRSGSMGADCKLGDTTSSKWCRSINALSGYFKSAGSMDQAAALQFFPLDNGSDALCGTGDLYNLAALPTADYQTLPSPAFDALLNSTSPTTVAAAVAEHRPRRPSVGSRASRPRIVAPVTSPSASSSPTAIRTGATRTSRTSRRCSKLTTRPRRSAPT